MVRHCVTAHSLCFIAQPAATRTCTMGGAMGDRQKGGDKGVEEVEQKSEQVQTNY